MLTQKIASAPLPPSPMSASEPPRVIPPERGTVFAASARRFEALAPRHALGDWLRFLGKLAQAQHEALQQFPAVSLHAGIRERATRHGMPPLAAHTWPRDPAWRGVLAALLEAAQAAAPAAGQAALAGLRQAPTARIEALADRVLRTELIGADAAVLPLVAAALQVYWTHMAAALGTAGIAPLDVAGVCPCCGFMPVASVIRSDGAVAKLRYLHCALCNTEWNFVRITCAVCDGNNEIGYRQIEGGSGVVRAETCETCHSYMKIVDRDKEEAADAVADDLATLALDMLLDKAGYNRAGPNLLLAPGGT